MPVIRNFADPRAIDTDAVVSLISNSTWRAEHVSTLTNFTGLNGFDGLIIDYRDIPVEQRDNFTSFIQLLAENMHGANLQLGVVVPSAQNVDGQWDTGAYNWREIGLVADYVQINFDNDPLIFTPGADQHSLNQCCVGVLVKSIVTNLIAGLSALIYAPG